MKTAAPRSEQLHAGVLFPPQQTRPARWIFKDSAGGRVQESHVRFQRTFLQGVWALQVPGALKSQKERKREGREKGKGKEEGRNLHTICSVKHTEE